MKKILCLTSSLEGGGAQHRMTNLAIMLRQRGYDVTVLAYFKEDFYSSELESNGVRVVKVLGNYLNRIIKVPLFIIKGKFDACISLLPTPNFLNCLSALIFKGNRIVITGESSCEENQFKHWQGKLYAKFRRYSDVIVCNSQRAEDMWLRNYPKYQSKLRAIYNPVILPDIKREYLPKQDGILHIVIASSVYNTKNPIGLIDALHLMTDEERSKIRIDWYGRKATTQTNGDEYIKAVELINEYHLNDVLAFHDPIKDIYNKVYEADASALFSVLEGLPNAICEGMMIGKPIIMTRVSDYDVLVDSSNGILCDWNEPESIKNALLRMADMSIEQLVLMGESSKKKAKSLFDNDKVVNQWIKLIEK